jgi:hypothetical protein
MHVDDDVIQRHIHGEPTGFSAHFESCAECRSRLDDARRQTAEIEALLGTLDVPAPPVDARSLMSAAQRRNPWPRRAAAAVLALTVGGAAWALPGSPLPSLFRSNPAVETLLPPDPGGVRVEPGARFVLRFTGEPPLRVAWTDDELISVRSLRGTAAFTSGDGLLVIDASGADTIDVGLPRTALLILVEIAGRVVLRKDGDVVTVPAPRAAGLLQVPEGSR